VRVHISHQPPGERCSAEALLLHILLLTRQACLLQVMEPKASGGLAANLVSTIRSFLPMGAAKPALPPGAGKKPVKVGCQIY